MRVALARVAHRRSRACGSLDGEQKEALVEVLATLLKDAHNMVLGSAVAVFNESALLVVLAAPLAHTHPRHIGSVS